MYHSRFLKFALPAVLAAFLTMGGRTEAQPWVYDFGTGTGAQTTASDQNPSTLLPAAPSGTVKTRVGTAGGSLNLENPGHASVGTDSELRGVAPTSTSNNKFAIFDYATVANSPTFSLQFTVRFGGGSSGTWFLFTGNGTSYAGNGGFSGTDSFVGVRWVYGASGAITTNIRVAGAWATTGLPATPFAQDTTYVVEIYGNNKSTAENYTRGSVFSLAANTWDLWIDGVRTAGLGKAQLATATNVDSFMFYAESSTGNVANIYLDDILYSNDVTVSPVEEWELY